MKSNRGLMQTPVVHKAQISNSGCCERNILDYYYEGRETAKKTNNLKMCFCFQNLRLYAFTIEWVNIMTKAGTMNTILFSAFLSVVSMPTFGQNNDETGNEDEVSNAVATANEAKALAAASKDIAEAKQAIVEAEINAMKAKLTGFEKSSYTGDVDVEDKAGQIESALLAAQSIKLAASNVADQIIDVKSCKKYMLFASDDIPDFSSLTHFLSVLKFSVGPLEDSVNRATELLEPKNFNIQNVATVGLALQALDQLFGYFRSEHEVGGIDLDKNNLQLLVATANNLGQKEVSIPDIYFGKNERLGAIDEIFEQLKTPMNLWQKAEAQNSLLDEKIARKTKEQKDTGNTKELEKEILDLKRAKQNLESSVAIFSDFYNKLLTSTADGPPPITSVIKETVLQRALDDGSCLVALKIHESGGSYFTKKNMLTFFGGMPFWHMGGVVVGFAMIDNCGSVRKAGLFPVHGGFVKSSKVERYVQSTSENFKTSNKNRQQIQKLENRIYELEEKLKGKN